MPSHHAAADRVDIDRDDCSFPRIGPGNRRPPRRAEIRELFPPAELVAAAELSAAVIMAACDATEAEARGWRGK
jgi:hypothetical protein